MLRPICSKLGLRALFALIAFGSFVAGAETSYSQDSKSDFCKSHAPESIQCDFVSQSDVCNCRLNSNYYFRADAMSLRISELRGVPLVLNVATLAPELSVRDLGYPFQTGTRLTIGKCLSSGSALEATYFGLMQWSSTATATDANNLRLSGDLGLATDDFFGADSMTVSQKTQIHNAELNYITPYSNSLQLLAGLRYFNLSEQSNLHSIDSDGEESDYRVTAGNHLIGGQVGVLKNISRGKWVISPLGKAGIYGNVQRASTFLGDFDNSVILRDLTLSQGNVSFLGEAGINGAYFFNKNVAIRGGYNNYLLTGIARGTSQFDFTDTPGSSTTIKDNDVAFIHGFNGGIEFRW